MCRYAIHTVKHIEGELGLKESKTQAMPRDHRRRKAKHRGCFAATAGDAQLFQHF
jgi:hypothetical protein